MFILLGLLFATFYWTTSTSIIDSAQSLPRWILAIAKWLAAIATHHHWSPIIITSDVTAMPAMPATASVLLAVRLERIRQLFRWITISAYSIGDVMLMWDETSALPFFGIGHVAFVITVSAQDLIPGVLMTVCEWAPSICEAGTTIAARNPYEVMYYIGVAHIAAVATTFAVLGLWILRNGFKLPSTFFYAAYMYTLALALFVGVCYQAYGVVLFVASDVIIGFRVNRLHTVTYPLYYFSLMYLYYFV